MKISKKVMAGSVESGDVFLMLTPAQNLEIQITSKFYPQFGQNLKEIINQLCQEFEIQSGLIALNDQGALPVVVRARFLTALERMKGE